MVTGLRATPSLFTTLQAQIGRVFGDAAAVPEEDKVVVLAHAL